MKDAVRLANENYSIVDAYRQLGVDADESNRKQYCPFGAYHSDFGDAASMRVYADSNTSYCFACARLFTPVRLIAQAEGISEEDAANGLLMELGYVEPTLDEKWALAVADDTRLDLGPIQEAFRRACKRTIDGWDMRQYDDDVSELYAKCLTLLNKVTTLEQAEKWLDVSKMVMTKKFGRKE